MSSALPSVLPPVLPPVLPSVSPAAPPSPPAAHPRNGDGGADDTTPQTFAHALDQAVAAEPRPPASEHGASSPRARASARASAQARAQAQAHGGEPCPPGCVQAAPLSALAPARADSLPLGATDGTPEAADEAAAAPAAPAGVGELLAQLRASSPALPGADPAKGVEQGRAGESAPTLGARLRPASTAADLGAPGTPAVVTGGAATARLQADEASAEINQDLFATRLAAATAAQAPTLHSEAAASLVPGATPAGALATASPTAAAAAQAQLPARPGSAEFGTQLSAQITTFVRAGVQHARLQLNPADLGPVSVHIQLSGQTALVHLSAEHAQTRQALEQAMPQLASSLRDAGLTLTGGGVFQQPHPGRDAAPDTRGAQSGASSGPGGTGSPRGETTSAVVRHRGVVDLVA